MWRFQAMRQLSVEYNIRYFLESLLVSSDQAPVRHRQKFRTVTISVRWRCRGRFISAPAVPLTCRRKIRMIFRLLFAQKRNRYFSFLPPSAWGTPAAVLRRSPLGRPGIFLPVPFLPHRFGWLSKQLEAYFVAGGEAGGTIRFYRKASAAKPLAGSSRLPASCLDESGFPPAFQSYKESLSENIQRYTQGHPLIHALRAGALRAARYDKKHFLETFLESSG